MTLKSLQNLSSHVVVKHKEMLYLRLQYKLESDQIPLL